MTHFEKEKHKTHGHHEHGEKKHRTKNETSYNWIKWSVAIQIILLIVIIYQINGLSAVTPTGTNGDYVPTGAQPSARNAPTPNVNMVEVIDDDTIKGDPDAPVTIVEWSDYECPFCTRFYEQTLGQIEEEYIDTGKVKFVYRDFPLSFHANAQKAAEAAECAGEQEKYFEMHDKLFEDGVAGGVASFKQYAQEISLNTADFNTCLDSGEMASEVRKDFADGQRIGISGTPGFIINGQLVSGALPFEAFQQVIEAELNS